jgi:hypothetical protein
MSESRAEKWVDFRETKDIVRDIKNAAGATLVSAASVSFVSLSYGRVMITLLSH